MWREKKPTGGPSKEVSYLCCSDEEQSQEGGRGRVKGRTNELRGSRRNEIPASEEKMTKRKSQGKGREKGGLLIKGKVSIEKGS